ncbi:MAG: response regulator [Nitrospinaceae bacterium]
MAQGIILVIDDEADVREVIRLNLEKAGFNVMEAKDGQEGIDILKSGANMINTGAILCDVRMPNVNGVEAIDYFKREAPGIPIVVITGYPDTELAVSFLQKGVKDYLVKPVEKEKLLSVVQGAVAAGKDFDF